MIRTKHVTSGDWRTLEWFWNSSGTAFFQQPSSAKIRVRYGGGSWWNGFSRQEQTLNGKDIKKLSVSGVGSLIAARMQIKVPSTTDVSYDVYPGQILSTPPIPF